MASTHSTNVLRTTRSALSLPAMATLAAAATPAQAYIGPGAGLGAIALAVALLLGVVLLLVGLVWYPLKRMLRGRKASQGDTRPADPGE
ncbi:MAG: hypothetical protein AAFX85_02725 [Pseudomonadota bacterium]